MILVISLSFLFLLCESLGSRRLIYLFCWKKLKMKSEVGSRKWIGEVDYNSISIL